jgi:anti-anti-sigma factor
MTDFELRIDAVDGIVYVTLSGDIDMSNVQHVRQEFGLAVTNQEIGLVLDLSDVDYLDSAGMHLVHSLRTNLRGHGQQLALVIPPGSVINDALRLAGVNWEGQRIASAADAPGAFGVTTPAVKSAADH